MSPSKNWHLLGDVFIIKNTSKNGWFVPNCCTNQNPHKHWLFEAKFGRNFSKSGLSQNVIKTSFIEFKICVAVDKEKCFL